MIQEDNTKGALYVFWQPYKLVDSNGLHIASGKVSVDAVLNSKSGCGSSTRGIWGGGSPGPSNVLEFVTISTLGNTVDFGNLTLARDGPASGSSHIKGIWAGGGPVVNNIDTINIGSLGNAVNFGDLTIIASYAGAASNSKRVIFISYN